MTDAIVLMSTYNGENYISEQLDSILNQDYGGSIRIIIRDDGSTDNTQEIIEKYKTSPGREILLLKGSNIGPQRSFLELIRVADEAKYYFFSDQDDIWYLDKIKRSVQAMENRNAPTCYCSNYDIYNTRLGTKRTHILQNEPQFTPIKIIMYNQIPGCVMGFNSYLMKLLKSIHINNVMMHDSMVLSLASAVGEIVYDDEPTIEHRIHGNNVVGEGHKKIIPHKWIIDKINLVIKKDEYDISEMAKAFLQTGAIKKENESDLILIRDFKKSVWNTIRLLRHPDTHDVFWDRTTMSIRCKILFHVF